MSMDIVASHRIRLPLVALVTAACGGERADAWKEGKAAAEGASVMLSSHLLGQSENLCTSLLIVREGELLVHGSRDALRARYADEVGAGASLEDIFFHVTEGQVPEDGDGPADAPRPADAGAAA